MDIANQKLSEMHTLVSRIRLSCAAVGAFREELEQEDQEMLDYMLDAAEALRSKMESILIGGAANDPFYELDREQRHDLRNSITAVLGFAELLLQCYTDPVVMIQQLERLRTDAKVFTEMTLPPQAAVTA